MKTTLTDMLETSALPREAEIPFREAEICYRAGAYRAALLFSYLGWGLTLRARLLQASCPTGLQPTQWQVYLVELGREDRWDAQVFDLTQMRSPAPVFAVADDLRHQVRYWKDRRNDCAHFKANEINHAHVESFWQFIKSNMGKFVPNGSEASLLNEIIGHFNPNITPPNTPIDPISGRIPDCVETANLASFFASVTSALTVTAGTVTYRRVQELGKMFDAVVRGNDPHTVAGLTAYLVVTVPVLLDFIREFPQHVSLLNGHPTVVRQIWHQHLFTSPQQDLHVFAALMRNNLVPQPEIAEANERAGAQLRGDIPSASDAATLQTCGFFAALEQKAFTDRALDDFDWGNRNCHVIQWYLAGYPISTNAVRTICSIFSGEPYPFSACNSLSELFQGTPAKRHEFERIAEQEQLTLPTAIFGP